MLRKIILKNQPVEYELKTSLRSRRMRLAVYPGGRFVVSIPRNDCKIRDLSACGDPAISSTYMLSTFRKLASLRTDISSNLAIISRVEKQILEHADWILAKIELMRSKGRGTPLPKESKPISKLELKRLKVVALELIHRRLEYFNDSYGFAYNRVSIRSQKTRWGSCSRKGNLNFNVKIALLPPHLADYIIVHELCHLREMNHSPRFWKLVAQTVPYHKELRRVLRKEHINRI